MVLLKVAFKMKTDWHNYAIFETQFFTKEAKVFSKIKVKQEKKHLLKIMKEAVNLSDTLAIPEIIIIIESIRY